MEKVERINKAFQYLRSIGKIHTQKDLSIAMNANRVTISNALKDKGGYLNEEFLSRFCNTFDNIFNEEWLLTGEGDMFATCYQEKENIIEVTADDFKSQTSIGQKERSGVEEKLTKGYLTYLLPMSAMGGSLTGFAEPGVTLQNCEAIISPIENVDFAITVYGESMAPEYPSGSRILIKKVNPDIFIDWGKVFVLDTPNGVIVKEVHESSKEGHISCHSINPDPKFKPFDVPIGEIHGMYRVLMCLSAK